VQVAQTALRQGDAPGIVALGNDGSNGWVPTWARPISIESSTPFSTRRAADLKPAPAHWFRQERSRPGDRHRVLHSVGDRFRACADRICVSVGITFVAVDMLVGTPFTGERDDPLVDRMWALQRSFMHRNMSTVGVDVVSWGPEHTLDQAMALVPQHRRPRQRLR